MNKRIFKSRYIFIIFIAIISLAIFSCAVSVKTIQDLVNSDPSDPSDPDDPDPNQITELWLPNSDGKYEIETKHQLSYISANSQELVKNPEPDSPPLDLLTLDYILTADIVYSDSSISFTPIGAGNLSDTKRFVGSFDGGGYSIKNLLISASDKDSVGLFGYISGGSVSNLVLEDFNVQGKNHVGILAGIFSSFDATRTVNHVAVKGGTVQGKATVGGLVGINYGIIENSSNTASVTGEGDNVGGLVGENFGVIRKNYSRGIVSGGGDNVGGLVGHHSSDTLTDNYNQGAVFGTQKNVGGLVGLSDSTLTRNYSAGSVSGEGDNVGGLVGENKSVVISNNYWDYAAVSGQQNAPGKGIGNSQSNTGATAVSEAGNIQKKDVAPYTYHLYYDDEDASGTQNNSESSIFDGWNFDGVWEWTDQWPTLRDNPETG